MNDELRGQRHCIVGEGPRGELIFEPFVRLAWANDQIDGLKAELAKEQSVNNLLWRALTPEKCHEINRAQLKGEIMIQPTVGRVVWYHPGPGDPFASSKTVQAAHICFVHSDTMVNLMVISPDGNSYPRTSVYLLQEGDEVPNYGYAEWMPYQKGQAAKTEALELRIKTELEEK